MNTVQKQLLPALLGCAILLGATVAATAQTTPSSMPLRTSVHMYALSPEQKERFDLPGHRLAVLLLEMEPDWYTYSNVQSESGKPTRLSFVEPAPPGAVTVYPEGVEAPDAYDTSVIVSKYTGAVRLYAVLPDDAAPADVSLRLDMLLCHPTKCIPLRKVIPLASAPDGTPLPPAMEQPWFVDFAQAALTNDAAPAKPVAVKQLGASDIAWSFSPIYLRPALEIEGLAYAMLLGLLAGLILNIMPCVLPVVSIKLTALLQHGGEDDEHRRIAAFREHNIFFALGVISFFLLLAAVLGMTGQAWGGLFQNQWLVLGAAAVIFILSLSLFGLYHLPVIDLKVGKDSSSPKVQAFFTGCLTTLLATPCSGPFLGGVLSWALVQNTPVIVTVFASIGFGMSLPYLLMAVDPRLSRFLPRSGPWIAHVEKAVALFLVGTGFYLLSIVLGEASVRFLAPLWAMGVAVWLFIVVRNAGPLKRMAVRVLSTALVLAVIFWTTPDPAKPDPWETFDVAQFQQELGGEPLFLNFTADWCPTCKALEAAVLTPGNVTRWQEEYGVRFIKVDMTKRDPDKEGLLRALGSLSLPTSAAFAPGEAASSPVVLRDLYTKSQLEAVLETLDE